MEQFGNTVWNSAGSSVWISAANTVWNSMGNVIGGKLLHGNTVLNIMGRDTKLIHVRCSMWGDLLRPTAL